MLHSRHNLQHLLVSLGVVLSALLGRSPCHRCCSVHNISSRGIHATSRMMTSYGIIGSSISTYSHNHSSDRSSVVHMISSPAISQPCRRNPSRTSGWLAVSKWLQGKGGYGELEGCMYAHWRLSDDRWCHLCYSSVQQLTRGLGVSLLHGVLYSTLYRTVHWHADAPSSLRSTGLAGTDPSYRSYTHSE